MLDEPRIILTPEVLIQLTHGWEFQSFYDKQTQRSPVSHIVHYIISCAGNPKYC